MKISHGACDIIIREEANIVLFHFNLSGKYTISDFRWMKRAAEFYHDDIGYVAVAPDESDDNIMRLVDMLGFVPTGHGAVYEDHIRRVYLWQKP